MKRISIASVLGIVAVVAFGLAALVNPTELWLGLTLTLMVGLLVASVLATVLRGWRRGNWLGFALFGWGSLLIGHTSIFSVGTQSHILPDLASQWIFSTANPRPMPPTNFETPEGTAYIIANSAYTDRNSSATCIGRWLGVLLFAEFGAILGVILARGRPARTRTPDRSPVR